MIKDKVTAYVVMESTMEPSQPNKIEVIDKNGLFFVRFQSYLQEFNAKNRNGRIYMKDCMVPSLQAPHIQELMAKKSWFGEAGHPMTNDVARILTLDPKLLSHKINSISFEGNMLKGEVETLDNGAYGSQMTKAILQGMEPAFSLRALASLTSRGDGTKVVQSKCHIVGYDWVVLPSHNKAYRDESKPVEKIIKSIDKAGNTVMESLSPVSESQIIGFLKEESKNIKVISNVYEVALESMQLSPDMKFAILKEGGNTFHVKLEDKLNHDINSFMRSL